MKKFFFKLSFFFILLGLFTILIIVITSYVVSKYNFKNYETESNLLVIKPNKHYNLIFIGNSHARNFARYRNHLRVEKILDKKILNLGRSAGLCGITEYPLYLQYAYSENITADIVICNIFSQMLYSDYQNKITYSFKDEPFSFKFLYQLIKYPYFENKEQKIFYYLFSKLRWEWLSIHPDKTIAQNNYLTHIDTNAIKLGLAKAYPTNFDTIIFNKQAKILEEMIKTASKHNSKVIFITTPTLFGDWPHQEDVTKLMKKYHKKYDIKYYNFANCIKDPHLFYDHHHLNTRGIIYFTKKYLKPALNGDTTYLVVP